MYIYNQMTRIRCFFISAVYGYTLVISLCLPAFSHKLESFPNTPIHFESLANNTLCLIPKLHLVHTNDITMFLCRQCEPGFTSHFHATRSRLDANDGK